MKYWICKIFLWHGHPFPTKSQLSTHFHIEIKYGVKDQYATEPAYSPPLDDADIKRIQEIICGLLFYARSLFNNIFVALSDIGTQQAATTKRTNVTISQFLDYVATYTNDGIIYCSSNIILAAHADTSYLNSIKPRSCTITYIMLPQNNPKPHHNVPVLTIAQIVKFVMSSTAEVELAGLFITAKDMISLQQTFSIIGWYQPKTPLQTDNSRAFGVTNNTIMPRRTKLMDMRFHWLWCRESQD